MTDRTVTDLCELAKDEGAQRAETDRGSGQEIWAVTGPSTVDSEVPLTCTWWGQSILCLPCKKVDMSRCKY